MDPEAVDDEAVLQEAVKVEAARRRRGARHGDPEELLGYVDGTLPETRREELQEHLAACAECARTVLDLASFDAAEGGAGAAHPSEFETVAAWRRLERRRAAEPRRERTPSEFRALAAGLLLAVVGLGGWVVHLRGRVVELSEPRTNVLIGDLLPAGTVRERTGGADRIVVPPTTEHLLLLLNLTDLRSFPSYRVAIANSGGGRVWSSRSLHRGPEGNFTLEVDRDLLPAGTYHITLYGNREAEEARLAEYVLELQYPPSDSDL